MLVPNPFYRSAKAPVFDAAFSFQNQADMAKLQQMVAPLNAAGAEKDSVAYITFLDGQKEVKKTKKIGGQGYCIGGTLVVKTVAAVPNRIGAGASLQGEAAWLPTNPKGLRALIFDASRCYVFRYRIE